MPPCNGGLPLTVAFFCLYFLKAVRSTFLKQIWHFPGCFSVLSGS